MRKLMLFTLGFAAAIAVGAYLIAGTFLLILAAVSAAAFIICLLLKGQSNAMRTAAAILLGCALGALWVVGYYTVYLDPIKGYDGLTVEGNITATDYTHTTEFGGTTAAEVTLGGHKYKLKLYTDPEVVLSPGDIVNGKYVLSCTAEGDEFSDSYLRGTGVYLVANTKAVYNIDTQNRTSAVYLPAKLRIEINESIHSVFPGDTEGFAKALLLGDSSGLDYALDTDFKLSGIRHIIAVSGLHVSILFSLMYMIAGKRRILTALLGIPVLLLFAAVAGFTPSIVRACVMQIVMILAMLLNREYDPPTALSFAVLLMLAINPYAITSVSFQLSVGCMAGIFLFSKPIQEYLLQLLGGGKGRRLGAVLARWLSSGVSVSLSATVLTAPLSAMYFGTFSILAVITNLITLWAVSIIFYGIMASSLLSFFWLTGAKAVAWLISWLMRFVCTVAGIVASIPVAAVYTCSMYIVLWMVFAYILLTVFMLLKRKHPGVFAACLVLSLVVSILASWLEPRLDSYRVTVLDVGQGQCILLQCGGKNYLVDCGGDSEISVADKAAAQLLSQGIWKLDGLIITHYDKDHAGGVANLLTRVGTNRLYLPGPDDTTTLDDTLAQLMPDRVSYITQTVQITDDPVCVSIFAAEKETTRNESSLCVLFQGENCDILITGDRSISGEQALLSQTKLPDLEVLVAGHHGAGDATGIELLRATQPEIAVISVGVNNRYGHPSPGVLRRLENYGCRIYRTDLYGTVVIRG